MKAITASEEILDSLARQVLMVDSNNQSLIPGYKDIINNGLPKRHLPAKKKVLIIGAGISGMLAGKLLKDAGYEVQILEANDSRVGGRIKTFHKTADHQPFKDPEQYAEAGAMRIPNSHPLVNALIDKMGLGAEKQNFYNVDVAKNDPTQKLFQTWYRTNEVQARQKDYNHQNLPEKDKTLGFPVNDPRWLGQSAGDLLTRAFQPLNNLIDKSLSIEQQVEGWKQIIGEYDNVSVRDFLLTSFDNDEIAIQYVGTLQNLTSRSFLSLLHMFIDSFYINPGETYWEIKGGNYRLPEALLPYLQENIVFNARATEIRWQDLSSSENAGFEGVSVKTINEPSGKSNKGRVSTSRVEREFTADYLLVTVPFSSLRFVETKPMFSYHKRRAIIELHYDSATKVLLEFSERFWEWDEATWEQKIGGKYRGHNSVGGGSVTDNPNRNIYFPSHPVADGNGGVVLASYSWADDAVRWDSIPDEDRYSHALQGIIDLYGEGVRPFYTGHGTTQSWVRDYYAMGEAAVFAPGEITELHPWIPIPEGNVFFAGEHTSLKHAWIEGALESAIRASLEIQEAG
ncbi:MAG: FAD-dependent oxidoreductase [Phycisphaerae bacterium]|nr:FAD-dependent oxidoreductase [Saprospiraceae bacterium]